MEGLVPTWFMALMGLGVLVVLVVGAAAAGGAWLLRSRRQRILEGPVRLEDPRSEAQRYRECADFDEALSRLARNRTEVELALDEARSELDRIRERMAELSDAEDREHVVAGYRTTEQVLVSKVAELETALSSGWRAAAVLTARRELARHTRTRPELGGLPETGEPEVVGRAWRGAAYRVREHAKGARVAADQLEAGLPEAPDGLGRDPEVEAEVAHVRGLLEGVARELERLADELTLVVDHQRALSIEADAAPAGTALADVLRDGDAALAGLEILGHLGREAVGRLERGEGAVSAELRQEEARVLADAEVGRI